MPDETPQNPTPDPTSLPTTPQATTEAPSEITPISEVSNMPPESPEAQNQGVMPESSNIPPSIEEAKAPAPVNTSPNPETSSPAPVEPAQAVPQSGMAQSEPKTGQIPANDPLPAKISLARELLTKARNAIQFRKRKKLDKVMSMFDKKKNGSTGSPQVTNDEVEKFLHVSDATATRYLSELEKEGRIKQNSKTGKGVSYSKI